MPINRQYVYDCLLELEVQNGGYYGSDLTTLAKELKVTPFGLRKQITNWTKENPDFGRFKRLGKNRPTITLEEFIEIKGRRQVNPITFVYGSLPKSELFYAGTNNETPSREIGFGSSWSLLIAQFNFQTAMLKRMSSDDFR